MAVSDDLSAILSDRRLQLKLYINLESDNMNSVWLFFTSNSIVWFSLISRWTFQYFHYFGRELHEHKDYIHHETLNVKSQKLVVVAPREYYLHQEPPAQVVVKKKIKEEKKIT